MFTNPRSRLGPPSSLALPSPFLILPMKQEGFSWSVSIHAGVEQVWGGG